MAFLLVRRLFAADQPQVTARAYEIPVANRGGVQFFARGFPPHQGEGQGGGGSWGP